MPPEFGLLSSHCERLTMLLPSRLMAPLSLIFLSAAAAHGADVPWIEFPGGTGPGAGKHIVLLSGDEEYRSEEALPMLARILSERHGFRTTVLFAVDPETGDVDPNNKASLPGAEALDSA